MRILAVVALALALGAAGCGGSSSSSPTTKEAAGLSDVKSVDQLRTLFAEHADVPRLLLIVSPT